MTLLTKKQLKQMFELAMLDVEMSETQDDNYESLFNSWLDFELDCEDILLIDGKYYLKN